MNWEAAGAIGELIAAAAVLATLIYLGRQIRSMKVSEFSNLAASGQQFEFTLRENLERASDLICLANSGKELTEEQVFKLNQIMHMINARYFYQYVKIAEMKQGTEIVVHSMALLLVENPSIYELWLRYHDSMRELWRAIDGKRRGLEWFDQVKSATESMRDGT